MPTGYSNYLRVNSSRQIDSIVVLHETVRRRRLSPEMALAAAACCRCCCRRRRRRLSRPPSRYGLDEQSVAFCDTIHNTDHSEGGDSKPTSHILAYCIKGRILARRGQGVAAGEAFEAAVVSQTLASTRLGPTRPSCGPSCKW